MPLILDQRAVAVQKNGRSVHWVIPLQNILRGHWLGYSKRSSITIRRRRRHKKWRFRLRTEQRHRYGSGEQYHDDAKRNKNRNLVRVHTAQPLAVFTVRASLGWYCGTTTS